MLYNKLLDIYQNNRYLSDNFEFESYYVYLQQYLTEEINLGNIYLSPYRFSKMFSLNLEDSIKFFLAISSPKKNNFIQIIYKYRCEECNSLNFYSSNDVLNEELHCSNCQEEVYGNEKDKDIFVLVFEVSNDLQKEFKSLKTNPLSKDDADVGRGVSIYSASHFIKENPKINPELENDLEFYWGIVNE